MYSDDPLDSVSPSGTLEAEVSFIQPDHNLNSLYVYEELKILLDLYELSK